METPVVAHRIISNEFEREIYKTCLAAEIQKVKPFARNAPENSPARIEARAYDQTKAVMVRMGERVAA
jgi:hypothetical protein